jgi:hypothetical protein
MIDVNIDSSGNFTIGAYNYSPDCARHDEYLEIKAHFEAGNSDKYEFVQYIAPVIPELSEQDKINALEAQQTPRMLRSAALGDADSIAKLQSIEAEIAELRKQL